MRRSFVRLVISSVLVCWAIGFIVMALYARSRTWTEPQARGDGVFLVHGVLDGTPPAERAVRLEALRVHSLVELALVSLADVQHRIGRRLAPGERVPFEDGRLVYYFVAFSDGRGALMAGPVDPTHVEGHFPVGLVLLVIGLPAIAGLLAVRVDRRVRRVEAASQALAAGEFSARVDDATVAADELAANFNAMAERIERLVRSRDELVQAVSHELGSPLSRLRFHMELLEDAASTETRDRLDAMSRELDALDLLVAELLSYVQADELRLERQRFEVDGVLADLAELAALDMAEDRGVDVEFAGPSGLHASADPRLFQRAVENLLRNAVRHAAGAVRIDASLADGHLRVAVHDDGPGIPEAMRDQVRQPFYRLEADRGRRTGGAGLGLAIVTRIVDRHGGRLEIGDSPLGGALVITTWPAA